MQILSIGDSSVDTEMKCLQFQYRIKFGTFESSTTPVRIDISTSSTTF